ncbi:MAG: hypothetical protein QXO03_01355, partial [Thermoplasmatales archaeon]
PKFHRVIIWTDLCDKLLREKLKQEIASLGYHSSFPDNLSTLVTIKKIHDDYRFVHGTLRQNEKIIKVWVGSIPGK